MNCSTAPSPTPGRISSAEAIRWPRLSGTTLYLPLKFNDGASIPAGTFKRVEDTLIDRFGGVTAVRQEFPLRGLWRGATQVYEDEIPIRHDH